MLGPLTHSTLGGWISMDNLAIVIIDVNEVSGDNKCISSNNKGLFNLISDKQFATLKFGAYGSIPLSFGAFTVFHSLVKI